MERCIKDIPSWMIMDKLKINDGKTELLIVGNRRQLEKVSIDHLTIGDTRVSPVTGAKNLGTNGLNSNLNLNEHINKTCKIAYFHLHNIRWIRKYLSNDSAQTL